MEGLTEREETCVMEGVIGLVQGSKWSNTMTFVSLHMMGDAAERFVLLGDSLLVVARMTN